MKLRQYLAKKGWSAREFADRSGLSHDTINRIVESGLAKTTKAVRLIAIATDWKVKAHDLMDVECFKRSAA